MLENRDDFRARLEKAMDAAELKPIDLANAAGFSESTISQYRSGRSTPKKDRLIVLARALHVSPAWLMGFDVPMEESIMPVSTKSYPVLGYIACGEPIFMPEPMELYTVEGAEVKADFVLIAKGDSMVDARINDGDIVFIRSQPVVENGEIAAIAIGDECLLKRFYKEGNVITLVSANPKYAPKVYMEPYAEQIRVMGKAVAFQSDIE